MAYFVALASAWLTLSALTALRPGRRGIFAALAYPVGWAAGELSAQAIVVEGALLGLLAWWGWPHTEWLSDLVRGLAAMVVLENLALVAISFYARRIVRRSLEEAPRRPLQVPRARDDYFGAWWRTALQIPFHPRDMQIIKNVAYGPEPRHRLDVWRLATTPSDAPVIFYVHGGAWTFGDKREQGRPMLHEFVRRGWIAVSCNYRLAPRHPWPAQIEDVMRTLAWIKKNIAVHGGDPDRIVVAGGSAGGHLAALLALTSEDPTWRPGDCVGVSDWSVRGAIPFYGVLEMTGDESHWHGLGWGLRILLESRVVQRPYAGNEELYRSLSPYHRVHADAPPFLVIQGGNDTLVDVNVARDFVEEFRRVGVAPIYYVELPFTQHAFDVTASPRTSATTRAAVAFATSVTEPRPSVSAGLIADYQSPPTELFVKGDGDDWERAPDVAVQLGPFCVVTADNPFSRPLDEHENAQRRRELQDVLQRKGVRLRASLARDPAGRWPDEEGFALIEQSSTFARAVARAFDQFALYEVSEDGVRVRGCDDGELLV